MKKNLIPGLIIIASISCFSGCKWFNSCCEQCKKTTNETGKKTDPNKPKTIVDKPLNIASLKELEQEFLNLNRKLETKIDLKKKDMDLINLQKTIETKAKVANVKIKAMVQADESLKTINDQIVIKRQQLNDKKIEVAMRQQIQKEASDLIAKFKSNNQYKTEIEPLEVEVKALSQKYNTINLAYNSQIKELVDKKQVVMARIKNIKK